MSAFHIIYCHSSRIHFYYLNGGNVLIKEIICQVNKHHVIHVRVHWVRKSSGSLMDARTSIL